MVIGILTVDLMIEDSFSLKDKRSRLSRIFSDLRRKFNVAVAEVDKKNAWGRSIIAIVSLNSSKEHLNRTLLAITEYIDLTHLFVINDYSLEFI